MRQQIRGCSRPELEIFWRIIFVAFAPSHSGMLKSIKISLYMGRFYKMRILIKRIASLPFKQISHSWLNCIRRLSIAQLLKVLSSTIRICFRSYWSDSYSISSESSFCYSTSCLEWWSNWGIKKFDSTMSIYKFSIVNLRTSLISFASLISSMLLSWCILSFAS